MRDDDRRLVYSTDGSLPLPKAERKHGPSKAAPAGGPPDDGVVRVGCERRRGSSVTLIYGLAESEREAIGKVLRRQCGTGGTTKLGVIELQGDHRDTVIAYFVAQARRAKRMGG
ncbi:MAG TPA: hypothetical protein VGD50_04675 [Candidatus Baltobacteraceae bacterium]